MDEDMDRRAFDRDDGTRIVYHTSGEGPPVLLLHGFTMSANMWRENGVVEALGDRYRLIALDFAGHGRSDKPHDPDSYGRAYFDDIATLCARETDGPVHLVGFSMGAELALGFAAEQRDRAASLFLCGSGWSQPEALEIYGQFCDWARSMPADERPEHWDIDALEAVVAAVGASIPVPRDGIEALDIPARGVVGSEDPEKQYLERLVGVLPGFTLDVLPETRHEASWRHPSLPGRINEFLAGIPAA